MILKKKEMEIETLKKDIEWLKQRDMDEGTDSSKLIEKLNFTLMELQQSCRRNK